VKAPAKTEDLIQSVLTGNKYTVYTVRMIHFFVKRNIFYEVDNLA